MLELIKELILFFQEHKRYALIPVLLVLLLLGALTVGVGVSSLAAALGYGPDKAWSWTTPQTVPALAAP